MGDETVVTTTDTSTEPEIIAPTTVVEAPDNPHDLYQMILESQREIRSLYETHSAHANEKIAELCAKVEILEAKLHEQKPPTEEARDEALEEIAEVGDVLADLAESVIPAPGVDNIVTEPQAPVTVSSPNDSGTEADTIVESDIGTTGSASAGTPPANRRRRRGFGGIW